MKHTVTDVAPCRKRIELEFTAEEIAKGFDEVYHDISDSVQVKGFRKGHTPRRVLERKFGKSVNADVARHVFQKAVADIFESDKISPMEAPEFKPDENTVTPGQPFTHAFEIDVRPTFDLPDYAGLPLKDETPEPTDAEVDERLLRYARALARYHPVDGAAEKEDVLNTDILFTVAGKELVNEKDQNFRAAGTELLGLPCPDLEAKTIGAKAGDVLTFDLTLPDDHADEALRGQAGQVTLTIKGIERPEMPTIDDNFAATIGLENLATFRDRIRQNLKAEREQTRRESLERQAIDAMIAKCSFELPEAYLKRRSMAQLMQMRLKMAREGATREFMQEKSDELESTSRTVTERSIRWSIISDAIAEKENFEITPEDVQQHVDMLAAHYRITPAKMLRQIRDMDGMYALASEIRDGRVLKTLLDQAAIEKVEKTD